MSALELSIVIPAYNNWWLTRRCLLALDALRTTSSVAFETIVIDNASSDETQSGVNEFAWVRYRREEINTNFAGAGNRGAQLAQAPLVLFLNNDALPVGDAFAALVAAFADERVAIAGGCVLFEDGPVQATNLVVMTNGGWWTSYRNLPSDAAEVRRSREVIGVNGAAMVVNKAWFESVGGFDEGYINGCEDIDLFMRAKKSGRTLRYVADAIFHHYESASPNRYMYDEQNAQRFAQRWEAEMRLLPRIERGDIGAFSIVCEKSGNLALDYALEDLITGLRQFGHPIVCGKIQPWSLLDRRYRESGTLEWFFGERDAVRKHPTVRVANDSAFARFETFGVENISVPWLPCALPEAAERSAFFYDRGGEAIRPTDVLDCTKGRRGVSLAILDGLTDPCAYGNLALAHAGIPVVVSDVPGVRNVYCDDTAVIAPQDQLEEYAARTLAQPELLRSNAERMMADAVRRFSVRRAAMRLTDVARVARNGYERNA